eukprot:Skav200716  [mRNA]  locus=scaffold2650:153643:155641:- [translate_table: standard]
MLVLLVVVGGGGGGWWWWWWWWWWLVLVVVVVGVDVVGGGGWWLVLLVVVVGVGGGGWYWLAQEIFCPRPFAESLTMEAAERSLMASRESKCDSWNPRLWISKKLVGCIYGRSPTPRAFPVTILLVLLLLLAAVTCFFGEVFIADGLRLRECWGFMDVILLTLLIFLGIWILGALLTLMAAKAGWFQHYQITSSLDGAPSPIENQMICIISTYLSLVLFSCAVVIAALGTWILTARVSGLGLLGAAYLVAAVVCLQRSVWLLQKRNENKYCEAWNAWTRAHSHVISDPEKLLEHLSVRHDGGLPVDRVEATDALADLLQPRGSDYFLALWLLIRIGINLYNTVVKAIRGIISLAGTVQESATYESLLPQLVVSIIETVFITQYSYDIWSYFRERCSEDRDVKGTFHDPDGMLHRLHGNLSNIANYSLLRSISALNLSKVVDLWNRTRTDHRLNLEFLQAIVHGILAVISLLLKVSAVSPILDTPVEKWNFSDWFRVVAFINNIAGIVNLKEIENRIVEEFVFSDNMHISDVKETGLHTSWRCRLSLRLLKVNGGSVLKSLAVLNSWSPKKTQSLILDRDQSTLMEPSSELQRVEANT